MSETPETDWLLVQALTEQQSMFVYMSNGFQAGIDDFEGMEATFAAIDPSWRIIHMDLFDRTWRQRDGAQVSSAWLIGCFLMMIGTHFRYAFWVERSLDSVCGMLGQIDTAGRVALLREGRRMTTWVCCAEEDDAVMLALALQG